MYWAYMQRRKFKELETEAMVMWGYDPKKKKAKERQKDLAEKWNEDPLFNFPIDIEYLTADQVAQKLSVSKRFWKKMLPETRWTSERAAACLKRRGIVARRCSMNDRLWALYQRAREKGVESDPGRSEADDPDRHQEVETLPTRMARCRRQPA